MSVIQRSSNLHWAWVRNCLLLLALGTLCLDAEANFQDLSRIAPRLSLSRARIHWQVDPALLDQRVVVHKFLGAPAAKISQYFLKLADFSENNLATLFAPEGVFLTKGVQLFRKDEAALQIVPVSGWYSYLNKAGTRDRQSSSSEVLSSAGLVKRVLAIAAELGIDARTELETHPTMTDEKVSYQNRDQKRVEEKLIYREVHLARRVNGHEVLSLYPRSGVSLGVGNTGKIEKLEVVWRTLGPSRTKKGLSKSDLESRIRTRRAFIVFDDRQSLDPQVLRGQIESLRIQAIDLCYFERPANEIQEESQPIYRLSVEVVVKDKPALLATVLVPL